MAELTQEVIDMAESQPWEEDLRQDFYVKWLESEKHDDEDIKNLRAYINTIYHNLRGSHIGVERRRRELEDENIEAITRELGLADNADDPMEVLIAEEHVAQTLKEMSPLIREAFDRVVIDGESPEDIAAQEWVDPNTIYQRVWKAKKILIGEA